MKCPTAFIGDWKQKSVAFSRGSKHTWDVQGTLGVWLSLWVDNYLLISSVWMSQTLWNNSSGIRYFCLGNWITNWLNSVVKLPGTIQLSSQLLCLTAKVNCSLNPLSCFRHSVSFNVTSGIPNFSGSICCSKQLWVSYKLCVDSPGPHEPRYRCLWWQKPPEFRQLNW